MHDRSPIKMTFQMSGKHSERGRDISADQYCNPASFCEAARSLRGCYIRLVPNVVPDVIFSRGPTLILIIHTSSANLSHFKSTYSRFSFPMPHSRQVVISLRSIVPALQTSSSCFVTPSQTSAYSENTSTNQIRGVEWDHLRSRTLSRDWYSFEESLSFSLTWTSDLRCPSIEFPHAYVSHSRYSQDLTMKILCEWTQCRNISFRNGFPHRMARLYASQTQFPTENSPRKKLVAGMPNTGFPESGGCTHEESAHPG